LKLLFVLPIYIYYDRYALAVIVDGRQDHGYQLISLLLLLGSYRRNTLFTPRSKHEQKTYGQ